MAITRFAEATWNGDLLNGSGTINYVSSGAFSRMPVTWASRTEEHNGRTSPEELIAVGARRLLLDGVLVAAGQERHAGHAARRQGRDHLRQGRCRLEDREERHHGARRGPGHRRRHVRRARRGRQGRTARSRRRSRATSSCRWTPPSSESRRPSHDPAPAAHRGCPAPFDRCPVGAAWRAGGDRPAPTRS